MSRGAGRLWWSPEIEHHVGLAHLVALARRTTVHTCIVCGAAAPSAEPVNVLVYVKTDLDWSCIEFAHPACSPPQIVTVTGPLPTQLPAEGPPLWMAAWLIREPTTPTVHATIVLDSETDLQVMDDQRGPIDAVLSILLDLGWQPITALDGRYRSVPSCPVVLLPARRGYIAGPGEPRGKLITDLPAIDPVWIALAHRLGTVDVLAAHLGLRDIDPAAREPALITGIRSGLVLGARLPLAPPVQ